MGTIVTTAYRPTADTIAEAERIAGELDIQFIVRNKRSIDRIHADEQSDILVASKERLEFYPMGKTEPFFFHPNSAAFRTKRPLERDPLIEVSGLARGDSFLDCTLGMASDAITVSQYIGSDGNVVGCESNLNIAYILKKGLSRYDAMPHLTEAMRRVRVVSLDAIDYLKTLDNGVFDIIYMDPMFTEEIKEASNFTPVRSSANMGQLTDEWMEEAKRVAKKAVVLKAHFRSQDFERFGFERRVRPNTKFHYGVIKIK
ncbi:class I SAM-dependent methyltransferase [Planococcus halotolerans]|uniref:class I SAM-dependent methyltransferase n=1 Tax=Planococcus halotolerans TaxID=2233542 RepID=UPI0010926CBD|nr:class I SAM-dependent methyltransferase [Planococcus halotolerans]QHJ71198.1 class I SAM-dependent methyltransferase [Planococcus halotolerans]